VSRYGTAGEQQKEASGGQAGSLQQRWWNPVGRLFPDD
jgi:hypothetical protein